MTVRDNPKELRYEIEEDGEVRGFIQYRRHSDGGLTLVHTDVEPKWEGHGVGSALVQGTLDDIRARGLTIRPLCPFVVAYLERHPEYDDVVER